MSLTSTINDSLNKANSKISRLADRWRVRKSLRHVAGRRFIHLPPGEVAAVILGRNMSHYLDYFYEHYSRIGVKYFIFADNGSIDSTLDIVSRWKNTVVLSTNLNFRYFQTLIRQEITTRYCSEGWRMAVDPDELFDYVGSDRMSVPQLTQELRARGHTGLIAQMLDMVPDTSLEEGGKTFAESVLASQFFSLDDISSYPYFDQRVSFVALAQGNHLPNDNLTWKFGGVRRRYFGENCCLTKHPLFLYQRGVLPFVHPHVSTGLHLADFTAVLRHYKFSGDFLARETERIVNNRLSHTEAEQRAMVIGQSSRFRFNVSNMETDSSPLSLVEKGFLVMSEEAKRVFA